AYGAGFYYIPGTDICLRVGGYLRADYYVHTGEGTGYAPIYDSIGSDLVFGREDNKFRTRGRGAVILDARTNTSYGTLRSYAAFNGTSTTTNASHGIADSLDAAYIQFAGFTFGSSRSFSDSGYGYFFAQDIGHSNLVGVNKLAYTAQLGNGLSATLSLEDGSGRRNAIASGPAPAAFAVTPAGSTNAGQYIPDIVGNLRVDQAWGSAYVAAAASKLRPAAFIGTEGHTWGYGFGAGME